ncbi:MAG: hypothetical protein Q8T08_20680 [Ignavibacteria bacterium]|nr:hypothetical protein [Ignavibacteria bacterium]
MKKFLKKNQDLKIKDLRSELSRAYLIIAIMAVVSIVLFRLGSNIQNEANSASVIAVLIGFGLLAMLALIASFSWINCKK